MASYRNQINGCTKLLIVLLRIAIGWHLCYEGITKFRSLSSEKPFSAEMYLRYSTGPFREHFRSLASDDFHGTQKLDFARVRKDWERNVHAAKKHFSVEQSQKADQLLEKLSKNLDEYQNPKEIERYLTEVEEWNRQDEWPLSLPEQAEHRKRQQELFSKQRELTAPFDQWSSELRTGLEELQTVDQQAKPEPSVSWQERVKSLTSPNLENVDRVTIWGLTICGACLILGLCTRLSALGAAVLLGLFYFAAPPWPGLLESPNVVGSYLIVDKNLIEMIACLMLASSPSGIWCGLDALIRGMITRPLFGIGAREIYE